MANEAAGFRIDDVTGYDGTTAEPLPHSTVIVRDGRIQWFGPAQNAPRREGERVVDGSGTVIMPGMINGHVHLCHDGAADFFGQARSDSLSTASLRAAASARVSLEAGVTTVRDLGSAGGVAIEVARAVESGLVLGSRIVPAGRVITMTGGHGHFIGREADGVDGVRTAARLEIKAGARVIKTMATGGVLTPGVDPTQTAYETEELATICVEAHKARLRVAAHAIGNAGIKNALWAGVNSIEHGFYLDEEAIGLFRDGGSYLVPTLIAVERIIDAGSRESIPAWVVRKAESESGHHRTSFQLAVESGIRIAAGTDAGTPFNPHTELAGEIELMVRYGMPIERALAAATSEGARNLGLEDEVGRLAEGYAGDVVLVAGNPFEDVRALREVVFVAVAGRIARSKR